MGQELRCELDQVKPDLCRRVEQGQQHQKAACDAQNFRPGAKCQPAYVMEVMGPRAYKVKLLSGDQWWHHHQYHSCYCQVADKDSQNLERSADSTATSSITGDSTVMFPHQAHPTEDHKPLEQIPHQPQWMTVQWQWIIIQYKILDFQKDNHNCETIPVWHSPLVH